MPQSRQTALGKRLQRFREDAGLSISQLAHATGLSKSYLWSLENDASAVHPSGETLYKLAEVLGVSMSDLLGKKLLVDPPTEIPTSLKEFVKENRLPQADLRMLASIRFRGGQPTTKERWRHIYDAIKNSRTMDQERRSR